MALKLKFQLPEKLCIKDPQDTTYGKKLLSHAIVLMDELGFEKFTFKKLGIKMESSEVSIYRYFENKHLLLVYLNCWYWEWVSYLIDLRTMNITDAEEKLEKAIHCIIYAQAENKLTDYINERILFRLIMKESSKTYHIAAIDEENKYGFFLPYKELVGKISSTINEVKPTFSYSKSLASTVFDMINNQMYYAEHLPRLTSLKKKNTTEDLEKMVKHFTMGAINYSG